MAEKKNNPLDLIDLAPFAQEPDDDEDALTLESDWMTFNPGAVTGADTDADPDTDIDADPDAVIDALIDERSDVSLGELGSIATESARHVVVIFGAGHIAQEVAAQAAHVGFAVDVLDIRPEYAVAERFPMARQVILCQDYAHFQYIYPIDARHYVVVLTHSHETDQCLLEQLLSTPARYLGVMGTERKKEILFAAMREKGAPDAELACVRCPIGVPVGAESAEEVGIAIAAELIAARTGSLRPVRPPHPPRR